MRARDSFRNLCGAWLFGAIAIAVAFACPGRAATTVPTSILDLPATQQTLSADGQWDSLLTLAVPTPRTGAATIYDPPRKRLLLFGGYDHTQFTNDVWELSLAGTPTWRRLEPLGAAPSARWQATMIYDSVRDQAVVFGGNGGGNEVWALSLSGTPTWSQLVAEGTPPGARYGHTAVYDPQHDAMIVFGGYAGTQNLNDTWLLSLRSPSRWTELPSRIRPLRRSGHGAAYDARRRRMVIFGGGNELGVLNDTWALDLSSVPLWRQLTPASVIPSPRYYHTLVYDSVGDRMLAFGGLRFDALRNGDTWSLNLQATQWDSIPGGPARWQHSAIYDPVGERMIVTAGEGDTWSNDTWSLLLSPGPTWSKLVPPISAPPSARHDYASAYDPVRNRLVLFGGHTCYSICFLGDTWLLDLNDTPYWSDISDSSTLHPTPRSGSTMVYDSRRDRMVLFGGYADGSCYDCPPEELNDSWALPLSGPSALHWELLAPVGTITTARLHHSAIYDPLRDRMLIYGGEGICGCDDLWALNFTDPLAWQYIGTTGPSPGYRWDDEALYDPVRDRMLLVGGADWYTWYDDVWALSLPGTPSWTRLTPAGAAPLGRGDFPFIYDPIQDRAVLFGGGRSPLSVYYNDSWSLSLTDPPTWTQILPANISPTPRFGLDGVYDSRLDRLVLFGGKTAIGEASDAWTLSWGRPTAVREPSAPAALRLDGPSVAFQRRSLSLTIATQNRGACRLELFDVAGRHVWTRDLGEISSGGTVVTVNLPDHLGAGLYFVVARQSSMSASRKLYLMR